MSLNSHTTPAGALPRANGFRRMSFVMLAARDRADRFEGLPPGAAKPLTLLAAFQEAEPYLGLPAHAFKLVSWLVKQTMAHDWETGSQPIAWPSARRQAEFLGISPTRVKALNRTLFEAGIFVLRDNEQGKRYGRRGPDKRIIEAYGFDLSPLAYRFDEFIRIAAAAKTERARMKAARARVTIARRAIRQAGELLTVMLAVPAGWPRLAAEAAELVAAARSCDRSDRLELAAKRLESLKAEAEQWVLEASVAAAGQASEAVNQDPEGAENGPHSTSTNSSYNLKDTVIAAEGRSGAARSGPQGQAGVRRHDGEAREEPRSLTTRLKLSVEELVHLAPRLGAYITGNRPCWRDAVDAAGGPLRHELGISASLWAEACGALGRDGATLALAIVAAKPAGYFTGSAGGYFGGMVRRAAKGELFLEKSLWGLRTSKYGRPGAPAGGGGHC